MNRVLTLRTLLFVLLLALLALVSGFLVPLRIVAASMEAYEHFLSTQVLQLAAVRSVNTSFVLRTKKSTTRLPVL